MNSYYALIYLNRELKAKLQGYEFVTAVTQQKNILEIIFCKDDVERKLLVSTDSVKTACFTDSRISIKRANVASFFQILSGERVIQTELSDGDRIVTISFTNQFDLILQLFGSKPNVLLAKEGHVIDAFKNPDNVIGIPKPVGRQPKVIPFSQSKGSLKKRIHTSFPFLQRAFIDDLTHYGELAQKSTDQIAEYLYRVDKQVRENPEFRILEDGRFCLISSSFIPDEHSETFHSIDDAIRVAFFANRSETTLVSSKIRIQAKLSKEIKRLNTLITAGEDSLKSLERAQKYEKFGNILMANAHKKSAREESVLFDDIYESGNKVEIQLKPELTLAENAAFYFEKKKKSERSFEMLQQQAEKATAQLAEYQKLEKALEDIKTMGSFREFAKEHATHPAFDITKQGNKEQSRPYLTTQFGAFEIWIGKNAKSNDVILRDSHKEDIWLHARGVSGSHVIIRMNKRMHDPEKSVLETAASWAAWKSKAKGSELVPVIWTRRKFVRKPKGAQAGAVLVDQEKVVLVQPVEPKFEYFT